MAGSSLFLVGDLAKAVIATLVAGAVHRGYPGLLPHHRSTAKRERETAAH